MSPEISVLNKDGAMVLELFQRYQATEDPLEKAGYLAFAEKITHSIRKIEKLFVDGRKTDLENFLRMSSFCKADADSLFADLSTYLETSIHDEFPFSLHPLKKESQLDAVCIERRLSTKATVLSELSGNSIENIHKLFDEQVVENWLKGIYLPQVQKVIDQTAFCKQIKASVCMTHIRKYTSCISIQFIISVNTILDRDQMWLNDLLKVNRRISEAFSDQKIFF